MPNKIRVGVLTLAAIGLTLVTSGGAKAQKVDLEARAKEPIEAVVIYPPTDRIFTESEHPEGQLGWLGDANGVDVVVNALVEKDGRMWSRAYRGDGHRNEDWFGWNAPVFAPIDGTVVAVNINETVNEPGIMTPGRATFVIIEGDDETRVMLAHLRNLKVKKGDVVKGGQTIGQIGNNGFSRHPHIHIGAWRGVRPLQVRFDLRAMGKHHEARMAKDRATSKEAKKPRAKAKP